MDSALATLVRAGRITQDLAESRSSTPEELRRLLGGRRARRMSTFAFKAMDVAGAPMRGQVDAESKQAVSDQLKARGLIDPRDRREAPLARDQHHAVRADHAQRPRDLLAPARDDGVLRHDDPARAVRARGADRGQEAQGQVIVAVRKDVEAGLSLQRRRSHATRRSSARCSSRWSAPARSAACSRTRSCGSPTSWRRRTRCAARSARRWSIPRSSSPSRSVVMIVLVVYIVPVFAGVLKQFATTASRRSRCPAMTQITVDVSHAITGYWYVFIARRGGDRVHLPPLEDLRARAPAVGRAAPEDPVQDRRHRPEDRDRALGAHVLRADRGRRAAARGARHHRQERRQRGRRAA